MPPTRDQIRAQKAYEKVSAAAQQPATKDDYGRQCYHLPALIHQCGLCEAISFFLAKGAKKDYFRSVLTDLADMMGWPECDNQHRTAEDFAGKVRGFDVVKYMHYSREAMSCAQWLKRYAEAILKVDATDDRRG